METKEAGPRVGEEFGGRVRVFAVRRKMAGSMAFTFQNTLSSDRPNACDHGEGFRKAFAMSLLEL